MGLGRGSGTGWFYSLFSSNAEDQRVLRFGLLGKRRRKTKLFGKAKSARGLRDYQFSEKTLLLVLEGYFAFISFPSWHKPNLETKTNHSVKRGNTMAKEKEGTHFHGLGVPSFFFWNLTAAFFSKSPIKPILAHPHRPQKIDPPTYLSTRFFLSKAPSKPSIAQPTPWNIPSLVHPPGPEPSPQCRSRTIPPGWTGWGDCPLKEVLVCFSGCCCPLKIAKEVSATSYMLWDALLWTQLYIMKLYELYRISSKIFKVCLFGYIHHLPSTSACWTSLDQAPPVGGCLSLGVLKPPHILSLKKRKKQAFDIISVQNMFFIHYKTTYLSKSPLKKTTATVPLRSSAKAPRPRLPASHWPSPRPPPAWRRGGSWERPRRTCGGDWEVVCLVCLVWFGKGVGGGKSRGVWLGFLEG